MSTDLSMYLNLRRAADALEEANRLKRIELVMRADQMSYIDLEGNHFGPEWHAHTLDVIRGDHGSAD